MGPRAGIRQEAPLLPDTAWQAVKKALRRARHAAAEFFFGLTTFGWVREVRRQRAEANLLFLLIACGDMLGLPLLPPYYALRLLPFIMPGLERWKRVLLRERDWTDLSGLIEGAQ
jgi:hypothetical protein